MGRCALLVRAVFAPAASTGIHSAAAPAATPRPPPCIIKMRYGQTTGPWRRAVFQHN